VETAAAAVPKAARAARAGRARCPRPAGDGQARFDSGAGIASAEAIAALTNGGVIEGGRRRRLELAFRTVVPVQA
jgi:hypothetical protein